MLTMPGVDPDGTFPYTEDASLVVALPLDDADAPEDPPLLAVLLPGVPEPDDPQAAITPAVSAAVSALEPYLTKRRLRRAEASPSHELLALIFSPHLVV